MDNSKLNLIIISREIIGELFRALVCHPLIDKSYRQIDVTEDRELLRLPPCFAQQLILLIVFQPFPPHRYQEQMFIDQLKQCVVQYIVLGQLQPVDFAHQKVRPDTVLIVFQFQVHQVIDGILFDPCCHLPLPAEPA